MIQTPKSIVKPMKKSAWKDTTEIYKSIFQNANDAIVIIDLEKNVRDWNKMAEKLLGYKKEEVVGRPLKHVPKNFQGELEDFLDKTLKKGGVINLETKRQHKKGYMIDVSITTALITSKRGKVIGIYGIIRDIREKKRREKKLRELNKELNKINQDLNVLAITDPLTTLYNRRYLHLSAVQEFNRAKRYNYPLSCLMIDIDYFKSYNDAYGHQNGDELLKRLAKFFRNMLRETDMIARYGGEEFTVLLPQATKEVAIVIAERIRQTLALQKLPKTLRVVTVSMGVSNYPEDTDNCQDLINVADKFLYQSKRLGRNLVSYAKD